MENKFCKKANLRNESDVEQFFIIRLLADLGYTDTNILSKSAVLGHFSGKGENRNQHFPDYQVRIGKTPILIIEAKTSQEIINKKHIGEAQDYATVVNRGFIGKNPIQYVCATNGIDFQLAKVDESKPILRLGFNNFKDGDPKYEKLKEYISANILKKAPSTTEEGFEFVPPDIEELKGIFKKAHNLIRRKQKIAPKKAFYEFTKLLFIKMREDRIISDKLKAGKSVDLDDFNFSVRKIEQSSSGLNWIKHLFEECRDELEREVQAERKKRIFPPGEAINLSPSTIIDIVEMIENFDLRSVEDDINGKVFETFLEASVRGKELGQFFTPRSVVRFMVEMSDLKVKKNPETNEHEPEMILDGSCGTGGFLIFALSNLFKKIPKNASMKDEIKRKIREEALFGIDASEDDIVPITRMNMYLHGDGGSHIFLADTLDKDLIVEDGLPPERQSEMKELRSLFQKKKFDVILTNPPFSMKYESGKIDEARILRQYEIASLNGKPTKTLRSNLMFLERYYDLLRSGGRLLTVIDESVLNTEGQGKSMKEFRLWLREKFIIRAIVSLPHNTFVNADAGVKTSVLYATKRISDVEEQPPVFMAISKDIGHNDAGRMTSEAGDLNEILDAFRKFQDA